MPYKDPEEASHNRAAYHKTHREAIVARKKLYREEHKEEISAKKKEYRRSHPEYVKSSGRRRTEQKRLTREKRAPRPRPERCEACGKIPEGKPPFNFTLHWDHDHKTGVFRGWICHRCNLALGNTLDDPKVLRALADYLELGAVIAPLQEIIQEIV